MMKRFISMLLGAVLALGLFSPSAGQLFGAVNTAYAAEALSVKANLSSGTYLSSGILKVYLTASQAGAKIYYSQNGSAFREYSDRVNIIRNSTLEVYAVKNGVRSATVTYNYILMPNFSFVTKDNANGTKTVFINCAILGVKIYYTTDGSKPTQNSALYNNNGITLNKTSVIKVYCVKSGWNTRTTLKKFEIAGTVQDTTPAKPADTKPETPATVSVLENYSTKWYYNQLNANQKKAYARIYDLAKNVGSSVSLSDLNITFDEFGEVYWAFDYDNPQFLELGNGYGYSYYPGQNRVLNAEIKYGRSKNAMSSIKNTFQSTTSKVISEASKKTSDYDKLLYIHDWIVNNTEYNAYGPAYKSEADGPVVYGEALCEGYSKAFMYMAQSLGFQCICVVGGSHMWNMVKLGNDWYHVDTTFDDPIMSDGSRVCRHDYFLVSTSAIRYNHTIDNPLAVPSAVKDY